MMGVIDAGHGLKHSPNFMMIGTMVSWARINVVPFLQYISHIFSQVTLALDSQALCCGTSVKDILTEGGEEFDVAFAVQVN